MASSPKLLLRYPQKTRSPTDHRPGIPSASTSAPTPDLIEDDGQVDEGNGWEDEDVDENPEDGEQDTEEIMVPPPKQWSFPKIRDPGFLDDLKNFQDMDDEDLLTKVTAAFEYIRPLQDEASALKKILEG